MTELMNEPRVRLMIESADDRGLLAEEELQAVAVDLELDEEDLEALTVELTEQGVEIVPTADAGDAGPAPATVPAAAATARVTRARPTAWTAISTTSPATRCSPRKTSSAWRSWSSRVTRSPSGA